MFIYIHAYMQFMTKVISLSDEAYHDLKSLKGHDKSFSEVVRELTRKIKRKKLLDLAGAWNDSPEMERIFKNIFEERHKTKERNVKL